MHERIPSLSLLLVVVGSMLLLAPLTVKGQQQPTQLWNNIWGGTGDEKGLGVAVGSDIYIVGSTESFGAGGYDAFLTSYDTDGNQLWNTTWGGIGSEYGYGVAEGSDNICIVGNTSSFGAGSDDAFLACYDADGNQLWNTTWGGIGSDYGRGVAVGSDIYIVGETGSFGAGGTDAFLACYDVDGNQLWNTTWGGTDWDLGRGVAVGSDIYIVGDTSSFGAGDGDAFLVKYGFLPPVAPVPLSDIRGRILEAPENSVYYVSTGNIYDSSAMYALYAYKENPQNLITSVWSPDTGSYLDVDGSPLFEGHIVALGGRFANRMVRYYEDAGIAKVGYGWNGTHHLFTRISDGSHLYAVEGSTYNASEKDYFIFQAYKVGDRYIFGEWGICAEGTYAGGACFIDIIYPNLQDYTDQYSIYSWTDLNDDDMPQQEEITLETSGS